jgi:predicted dienelactone hydrolase
MIPSLINYKGILVTSHGLGGNMFSLNYLQKGMLEQGYASVAPTHVGSDSTATPTITSILNMNSAEGYLRIKDIQTCISYMQQYLDQIYKDANIQVKTNNVVIAGHSFGGLTVLGMNGSTLTDEPARQISLSNISMSLQRIVYYGFIGKKDLYDARVKAVISIDGPFKYTWNLKNTKINTLWFISAYDELVSPKEENPATAGIPANLSQGYILPNADHFMASDDCKLSAQNQVVCTTRTAVKGGLASMIPKQILASYPQQSIVAKESIVSLSITYLKSKGLL